MSKINCIDLSEWQSNVNFEELAGAGITAVILRAGYGREVSQKDSSFESHYNKAKKANLKIGIYWYSYADSVADAEREANACLKVLGNKKLDLPIYYDMEDNTQLHLGKTKLTQIAEKFCETIKSKGFKVGVYANLNWFNNYLNYNQLKNKYSIWLAQYNSTNELSCDIWQNSSTARLPGYDGRLDSNIIFNQEIVKNNSSSSQETKKPTLTYRVYYDGRWSKEIKGLSEIAGEHKQAISALAVKVSEGQIQYRVHMRDKNWLPWVTGYDINDNNNGYAGIKDSVIDCVQIKYSNNNNYKVAYQTRPQGSNSFYSFQYDVEDGFTKENYKQDGYAGKMGKAIDGIQITLV